GLTNSFDAGTNAASGLSNLFVCTALNALLKVDEARRDKYGMCVRIHKARQDCAASAVEDSRFRSNLLRGSGDEFNFGTNSSDLSVATKDRDIVGDAQLR